MWSDLGAYTLKYYIKSIKLINKGKPLNTVSGT